MNMSPKEKMLSADSLNDPEIVYSRAGEDAKKLWSELKSLLPKHDRMESLVVNLEQEITYLINLLAEENSDTDKQGLEEKISKYEEKLKEVDSQARELFHELKLIQDNAVFREIMERRLTKELLAMPKPEFPN